MTKHFPFELIGRQFNLRVTLTKGKCIGKYEKNAGIYIALLVSCRYNNEADKANNTKTASDYFSEAN